MTSDKTIIDPAPPNPGAGQSCEGPGADGALQPGSELDEALARLLAHLRTEEVPERIRLLAEELGRALQETRRKG